MNNNAINILEVMVYAKDLVLQTPNSVLFELVEMHLRQLIMIMIVINIKRDALPMEQGVYKIYYHADYTPEQQQFAYYIRVQMAIAQLLLTRQLMVHVMLNSVQLLHKVLLLILGVRHIHTNVSLMAHLVLMLLVVRQVNFLPFAKVAQLAHTTKFA